MPVASITKPYTLHKLQRTVTMENPTHNEMEAMLRWESEERHFGYIALIPQALLAMKWRLFRLLH